MIHAILAALFSVTCFAQSASQLEAALQRKPDDMRKRSQLASIYAQQNQPDKVIELLNPYTDQMNPNTFLLLASSYAKKDDFANEVRVLNFLVNKEEDNYRWHMLLAEAHLKHASVVRIPEKVTESRTIGIQRLRRALQLNPKFKPAFDRLLKVFLDERSNNEARELISEGITKFGRRPELFRELCRLDSQDGFLVQAVANCTDSIKLSPGYPDHYVYLIQALHDQKEDQKAEREATKAAKRFTKSEFVQWAAGMLFLRKKNFPVAGRYFQAAVAAMPDSGRAQFGLAQAKFESGDHAGALEHFIKACKADAATLDTFLAAGGRLKQSGNMPLGMKFTQAANTCR